MAWTDQEKQRIDGIEKTLRDQGGTIQETHDIALVLSTQMESLKEGMTPPEVCTTARNSIMANRVALKVVYALVILILGWIVAGKVLAQAPVPKHVPHSDIVGS